MNPRPPRCERGALPLSYTPGVFILSQIKTEVKRLYKREQFIAHLGVAQSHIDVGLNKTRLVARIESCALILQAKDWTPAQHSLYRVGELNLACCSGRSILEGREDMGGST